MGLKLRTKNNAGGSVLLELFADYQDSGVWTRILSAADNGTGGAAHTAPGLAGLRIDYMDVSFDDYDIRNI